MASTERILTRPFRLSIWQLIYASVTQYLHSFWWFVALQPIFGVTILLLSDIPSIRFLGWVAICWPLTLPFRSRYALSRAMQVGSPVQFGLDGSDLILIAGGKEAHKPIASFVRIVDFAGYIGVYTNAIKYYLAPRAAFGTPDEAARFVVEFRRAWSGSGDRDDE